jgi:hypothetical protein
LGEFLHGIRVLEAFNRRLPVDSVPARYRQRKAVQSGRLCGASWRSRHLAADFAASLDAGLKTMLNQACRPRLLTAGARLGKRDRLGYSAL